MTSIFCGICFNETEQQGLLYCPDCGQQYHLRCWQENNQKCAVKFCGGTTNTSRIQLSLLFAKIAAIERSKILTECQRCHASVSSLSRYCVKCGYQVNPPKRQITFPLFAWAKWIQKNERNLVVSITIVAAIIIVFLCTPVISSLSQHRDSATTVLSAESIVNEVTQQHMISPSVTVISVDALPSSTPTLPMITQTPESVSTATPSVTPTLSPTPESSPTEMRVSPSPTINYNTCSQLPGDRWGATLWNQYKNLLGCPLSQEIRTGGAYQIYQRGIAIWRQDMQLIYILYNNGAYMSYTDASPANYHHSNYLKGGFGYLWNNNSAVQNGLGEPVTIEFSATNFAVQDFAQGTIFYFLENEANNYILFSESNTWRSTQD